jgi:hypothetical protein
MAQILTRDTAKVGERVGVEYLSVRQSGRLVRWNDEVLVVQKHKGGFATIKTSTVTRVISFDR